MNEIEAAVDRRDLALLSFGAFVSMASMRVCDPLLAAFAADFAVSTGVAARTISAFALAYGVLQLFYGPLGDRLGKIQVISYAVALCAACNIAIALAPSLEVIVIGRAVAGAAAAGIIPLTMAWIGDTVPYYRRQEVLARFLTATIGGMIAGQWIGGVVADLAGWRLVFVGLAGLFAIVAGLLRFSRQSRYKGNSAPIHSPSSGRFVARLRSVLSVRWARRVLIAAALEGVFVLGVFSFVPAYLHLRFGLSSGSAGSVLALYGGGGLMYTFCAKPLLRRIGERGLAAAGGVFLGASMGMFLFGGHWWWAMPGCLVGGFGFYMLHSTLQTNATQMIPHMRGTAVSAFVAFLFIGQSLGVLAASLVVDSGSPTLVFAAGLVILPLLGWWFSRSLAYRDRMQGEI